MRIFNNSDGGSGWLEEETVGGDLYGGEYGTLKIY